MTLLPRIAVALVLVAIAFGVAVVGAVETWAVVVLGLLTLLALLAFASSGRLGELRPRGLEWFLVGLLLLGCVQLVPLPPAIHRILSPEAARLFDAGLPAGAAESPRTLSLYPYATRLELFRLVTLALLFVGLSRGLRGRREAVSVLAGVAIVGAAAALFSLVDRLGGTTLLEYYPREAQWGDRLSGPFVNPNHFASFLAVAALAAVGLYLAFTLDQQVPADSRLRRVLGSLLEAGANRGPTVALLLGILAITVALFLTASRLGVFAFLAGLGVLALALGRGRRPGRALGALAGAAVLVLAVNLVVAAEPVLGRFSLFFDGDVAPDARVRTAGATLDLATKFPAFGTGLGTFGHVFPAYQPDGLPGHWDHAHSDVAQTLSEGGLIGAGLAAGFVVLWFREIDAGARRLPWRARGLAAGSAAAATACLVHGAGDFSLMIPANAYIITSVLATGTAVVRTVEPSANLA